jgi:hypothetical protein
MGCTFVLINNNLISNIMRSLLYLVAVILVIGWALGFFVYSAGSIIHILLVIAVIAILFRLIGGR